MTVERRTMLSRRPWSAGRQGEATPESPSWNHLNAVPLVRLMERWISPLAERGARALRALETHLDTHPRT